MQRSTLHEEFLEKFFNVEAPFQVYPVWLLTESGERGWEHGANRTTPKIVGGFVPETA